MEPVSSNGIRVAMSDLKDIREWLTPTGLALISFRNWDFCPHGNASLNSYLSKLGYLMHQSTIHYHFKPAQPLLYLDLQCVGLAAVSWLISSPAPSSNREASLRGNERLKDKMQKIPSTRRKCFITWVANVWSGPDCVEPWNGQILLERSSFMVKKIWARGSQVQNSAQQGFLLRNLRSKWTLPLEIFTIIIPCERYIGWL